jgi:hypothetical protein
MEYRVLLMAVLATFDQFFGSPDHVGINRNQLDAGTTHQFIAIEPAL